MEKRTSIRILNAVKKFHHKQILDDASIEFHMGEIMAIVSPDGSGKTTTINIISGFIGLDKGERIFSDGLTKRDISIVFGGEKNLYMKNTVEENMIYLSMMKGLQKAYRCILI